MVSRYVMYQVVVGSVLLLMVLEMNIIKIMIGGEMVVEIMPVLLVDSQGDKCKDCYRVDQTWKECLAFWTPELDDQSVCPMSDPHPPCLANNFCWC